MKREPSVPSVAIGQEMPADQIWSRLEAAPGMPPWLSKLKYIPALTDGRILVHEGDLEIDTLVVGRRPLVVTGNVRVRGLLTDTEGADETLLVILGNVDVENVATYSVICVAGDARIGGTLFGDSSGDHAFWVGGNLSAKTVIAVDHHVEVQGALDVDLLVGNHLTGHGAARQNLAPHDALAKGVYRVVERDEEGIVESSVDGKAIVARFRQGRPVLGGDTRSPVERAIAALKEKAALGKRATRLALARKKLRTVPDAVFDLAALESLSLDFNDIQEISPRIGDLKALRTLGLESLPIKTLPDELCRLPALKTLSLRYCRTLTELPAAFADLASLEELYLDAMALGHFPEALTRLPRLKKLWWWRVKQEMVDPLVEGMNRLPRLTHAGFFQCWVKSLPEDLSPLARLKQFTLNFQNDRDGLLARDLERLKAALPGNRSIAR